MVVNDPIGDTLTRIRNAYLRSYDEVVVLHTKTVLDILDILKKSNYVEDFEVVELKPAKRINVRLKYINNEPAVSEVKRVSKPGLRQYIGYREIPKVLNGYGIAILTTPNGILTGNEARKLKVGGEFLCTVY